MVSPLEVGETSLSLPRDRKDSAGNLLTFWSKSLSIYMHFVPKILSACDLVSRFYLLVVDKTSLRLSKLIKAPKGAFILTLTPLWSSSSFLETELLSLYSSRISLQVSSSFEWNTSISFLFYECSCNTKLNCI